MAIIISNAEEANSYSEHLYTKFMNVYIEESTKINLVSSGKDYFSSATLHALEATCACIMSSIIASRTVSPICKDNFSSTKDMMINTFSKNISEIMMQNYAMILEEHPLKNSH